MGIFKKMKNNWQEFIHSHEAIKELKKDRDFWEKQTLLWIDKYGHLMTTNVSLFNIQDRFIKDSNQSSVQRKL